MSTWVIQESTVEGFYGRVQARGIVQVSTGWRGSMGEFRVEGLCR